MESSDETSNSGVDLPKFKQLMFKLHEGFPNALFSEDQIKSVIIMETVRKDLLKNGFIAREKSRDGFWYRLGPNGLSLVNGWIMESSSNETERLTKVIYLLTGVLAVLALYPVIKDTLPTNTLPWVTLGVATVVLAIAWMIARCLNKKS